MTQIKDSRVLITGGASGIGRLMALKFAARGASVIVWDINQQALNKVVDELKARVGAKAWGDVCDVSNRKDVYAAADRLKARGGGIDVLINNAGVVSGKNFLELADEKIERTFDINTLAHFWTAKAFLPDMIKRNSGHIVTIASAGGLVGTPKLADYCASKWAAVGFDESLRVELKRIAKGVITTVICPFFIDTGMFAGVKTRFPLLLPILKEDYVAERIVRAVERNHRRVWMPWIVYTIPLLRLFPVAVMDAIATLLGVNATMDEFRGR